MKKKQPHGEKPIPKRGAKLRIRTIGTPPQNATAVNAVLQLILPDRDAGDATPAEKQTK